MKMLQNTGKKYSLPVVTDIHSPEEARIAAGYVDVLQIPAFLCRQTDLLVAAAETGKIVNVKKGQFVSGEAMKFAVDKIIEYTSKFFTLKTGDLIYTGTPSGIGPLNINDHLEAYLEDKKLLDLRIK